MSPLPTKKPYGSHVAKTKSQTNQARTDAINATHATVVLITHLAQRQELRFASCDSLGPFLVFRCSPFPHCPLWFPASLLHCHLPCPPPCPPPPPPLWLPCCRLHLQCLLEHRVVCFGVVPRRPS